MARILLLMTRPLAGAGGRGLVLRTIVDSLTGSGHDVVCAVVGGPSPAVPVDRSVATHRLPDVRWWEVASPAARRRGLRSLNERLYWSPRVARHVRRLVETERIDAVVADGLRLAPYAQDSGRPWFVDLDDLLSDRYDLWRSRSMDLHQLLGHRRPSSALAGAVLRRVPVGALLAREARRLREREEVLARTAHGTSLVSPIEAARLSERAGVPVQALPMAVTAGVRRTWTGGAPLDRRLAFPGSLTAYANEEAVRWWVDELEPALRAAGLTGWELHVYGEVPPSVRARVSAPSVVLRGAFDREALHAELVQHSFLLAPQREALGLTVKVVEAAVLGLVPLTTPQGASGMAVTHGEQVLLFRDGPELAEALSTVERWAAEGGRQTAALAARARAWARDSFAAEVLTRRWGAVVQQLVPGGAPRPRTQVDGPDGLVGERTQR
ncbi:glycosyltransferase [Kineococcus rhizosphaerae]|uniref:Glycosyl transferase family 1 n=1 Tax=Kineococcus rhizosphaerae TaxID=559628 RepID=A0A2T0RA03_9ACTN|nr:glycosyltransferase [Kineococcus rhizosphaerae]PRY17996.1 glycosyl transferase family 1 [Kineococcus rhizosphaerae]